MIRLGLRLALASGREAAARLGIIAVAVALGVSMLLAILAGINAVNTQASRYAWLSTGGPSASGASTTAGASQPDPLWWLSRYDYFDRHPIGRIDVAATGPDAPVPPGIPRLPGPGEYYASPAMSDLLASTPAAQLGARYPGHQIGTVGRAGVPEPTSLLIIIGHSPEQLSRLPGAGQVTHIATTPPDFRAAAAMELILGVVAAGLLFPVLMFIGTATRLAAARREQRFAAMRLVGATPRQISVVAAVETTAAAVAGTALGFGLFALLHGPLATIPFTGAPFYPDDLSLNAVDLLLVALGVPASAAVAARIALRRVRVSPLGVTRRVTPRPPRLWRLIPLVAGLGELTYFVGRRPDTSDGQLAAFLPGILLIMAGLVIAGPWLTMVSSRVLAGRSRRPATLIAARRLADNPRAAFRAISGLVLALFVTTVAAGVITTIVAERGPKANDTLERTTLSINFWRNAMRPGAATSVPDAVTAGLRATPGVRSTTVVRRNPAFSPESPISVHITASGVRISNGQPLPGVVSCAELAPAFGRCPAGATTVQVWDDIIGYRNGVGASTIWPASAVTADELQRLPVLSVVAATDGSTAALEQARTVIEVGYPDQFPPAVQNDIDSDFTRALAGWQQLANVVTISSLVVAGCGLAVSVVGGLAERRRPFSLLRLSGTPVRLLRRVVALESAVPLLVAAAVAVGAGLLAAQLFLRAQMYYTLRVPGPRYWLLVIAGLAASLGIIASTLPLLRRITGPETARND